MQLNLQAKLYTGHGKYDVEVTRYGIVGPIFYEDPERRELITAGETARFDLKNRGWFMSDFWVTDLKNSPPLWRHKLTMLRSDGDKLIKALSNYVK